VQSCILMRKKVNNDLSKDSSIRKRLFIFQLTGQEMDLEHRVPKL